MTEAEFLPLFDRYHNMVYRMALTATRSRQDAEDIVQTVFLKLLSTNETTRPQPDCERAWLVRVTINACRDLTRFLLRQKTEPLDESIPFSTPEERGLFDAVLTLPTKYRVTVHLHYYEGYTLAEIGELLHISPSAVSMRLHRARQLLRSKLKEEEYEPPVSEHI